jgi:hypothetical protein
MTGPIGRLLLCAGVVAALGACESTSTTGSAGSDGGMFGSLFGGDSSSAPAQATAAQTTQPVAATAATSGERAPCPPVEIQTGTGAWQQFDKALEGQAMGLKYQASVADTARECSNLGAETAMRIGIVGKLLVGPKGVPGKVDVPLRIAIIDDKSQPVYSKLYRIPVTIAAGQTYVNFTHVEEGVLVPAADSGFRVLVGFDDKAASGKRS